MGINIGAFVCNFVAAYLRNNYTWGYAFAAAGVGMVIGLIWFASGLKHVKHADVIKPVQKEDMPISKIFLYVFVPALIAGAIGWIIPGNIMGSDSNDAFIFACIPIIIFYFSLWYRATGFDKKRISTLLILFGFQLSSGIFIIKIQLHLTIWAQTYTDREAPKAIQPVLKPFEFLETVNTKPTEVPVVDNQFRATGRCKGKGYNKAGN